MRGNSRGHVSNCISLACNSFSNTAYRPHYWKCILEHLSLPVWLCIKTKNGWIQKEDDFHLLHSWDDPPKGNKSERPIPPTLNHRPSCVVVGLWIQEDSWRQGQEVTKSVDINCDPESSYKSQYRHEADPSTLPLFRNNFTRICVLGTVLDVAVN